MSKPYAIYNPPQNSSNFDLLNISHKTVVLGDLYVHSTRWGFKNINTAGREIEDMLNYSPLELIYSYVDHAIYLHYNESKTTSHLFLASSNIGEHTHRKIIDDSGSGHKPGKIIDDPGSGHKPVREIIDDPGSGHKPVTAK
ncbi:unnamed protein product [Rodentolepis nana]|uniref:Endo/exonuclease/phosphatase domain-containing protein n=1 Tax=Rodentolepis nana TaxID=102285 RepID=A0A0R3TXQ8_RODNA|nr:unnamed protein product [Rodentolepis nana]